MANDDCPLREVGELLRRLLWGDPLLQVGSGDAVHLRADDWVPRVDERAPTVGDLATLDLYGGNLNEVGELRVEASGLSVHHNKGGAVCGGLCEGEDAVNARLNVRNALHLPYLCAQLLLQGDQRLDGIVPELNRLGHLRFVDQVRTSLNHHDGVCCAGDHKVKVACLKLLKGWVQDELVVDKANANGTDWAKERDLRDRERR